MEEEFFSTIKLITGEEIVAKVCYLPEENQLLVENPKKVMEVKQRRNGEIIDGFVLVDWIHSRIEKYYLSVLNDTDEEDQGRVQPSHLNERMGYLGSVSEMKKKLEKIYKIS